jgi:hypothetical protein
VPFAEVLLLLLPLLLCLFSLRIFLCCRAQFVLVMLVLFTVTLPFLVMAYVENVGLAVVVTVMTTSIFWTVNEVARDVEDAFIMEPNSEWQYMCGTRGSTCGSTHGSACGSTKLPGMLRMLSSWSPTVSGDKTICSQHQ